jgi:uncharacterized membrane protein
MTTLLGYSSENKLKAIPLFLIWLFQLTAIIGVTLGHYNWFITKTPINLLLTLGLLIMNFPIDTKKKVGVAIFFYSFSFIIEWIGVHYRFLFGEYTYGNNLGIKVDGVPLLIGANWLILIFCTATISDKLVKLKWLKIVLGAAMMVLMDLFIETSAPLFDFWKWELGYAPLHNFIGWFLVALIMQTVYHLVKLKGDFVFSFHLYAAQLTFFIYFFLYHLYL